MNSISTKNKTPSIVVCMTTFSRVDCARINMEIIKLNYPKQWPIVHACSNNNWGKYLEDVLVKREPKGLQDGALDLLVNSLETANKEFHPDFIIHIEGDTWLMNQAILEKYVQKLESNPKKVIATARWNQDKTLVWKKTNKVKYYLSRILKPLGLDFHVRSNNTLSSQFFIIKNDPKIIAGLKSLKSVPFTSSLETELLKVIKSNFGRLSMLHMKEREPVHPSFRDSCEALELYCQHSPEEKLNVLKKYPSLVKSTYIKKLINADNYDYYNPGARRD